MKGAGPQRSPIRPNQRYTKGASVIIFYVVAAEDCESRKWEKWVALSFTAGGIGSSESHLKRERERFSKEREGETVLGSFKGKVNCCWGRQWKFCLLSPPDQIKCQRWCDRGSSLIAIKYRESLSFTFEPVRNRAVSCWNPDIEKQPITTCVVMSFYFNLNYLNEGHTGAFNGHHAHSLTELQIQDEDLSWIK